MIFLNHLKLSAGGSLAWKQGEEGKNFKVHVVYHLEKLSVGIQAVLQSSVSESPSGSLKRRGFKRSLSFSCRVCWVTDQSSPWAAHPVYPGATFHVLRGPALWTGSDSSGKREQLELWAIKEKYKDWCSEVTATCSLQAMVPSKWLRNGPVVQHSITQHSSELTAQPSPL